MNSHDGDPRPAIPGDVDEDRVYWDSDAQRWRDAGPPPYKRLSSPERQSIVPEKNITRRSTVYFYDYEELQDRAASTAFTLATAATGA